MKVAGCLDVISDGGVANKVAMDGFTLDKRNSKARYDIVPCLDVTVWEDWVLVELDGLSPF